MGVIVGKNKDGSKNKGVKIFTNDTKSDSLIFAFHGMPLTKNFAESFQQIETNTETKRRVYMPYTDNYTSTMSHEHLIEEMDKYYQLTKKDLLEAKTIDILGHSYGTLKSLAFVHAISKDTKNAPKILQKVKNLHLYNPLIDMKWDLNHSFAHNIKIFALKICIFLASLLRGEKSYKTPDVVKSLINLQSESFKPTTLIAYNPDDIVVPSSEKFMDKVRSNLAQNSIPCSVINDSNLVQYTTTQRGTGTGLVRRFEEMERKLDLKRKGEALNIHGARI